MRRCGALPSEGTQHKVYSCYNLSATPVQVSPEDLERVVSLLPFSNCSIQCRDHKVRRFLRKLQNALHFFDSHTPRPLRSNRSPQPY